MARSRETLWARTIRDACDFFLFFLKHHRIHHVSLCCLQRLPPSHRPRRYDCVHCVYGILDAAPTRVGACFGSVFGHVRSSWRSRSTASLLQYLSPVSGVYSPSRSTLCMRSCALNRSNDCLARFFVSTSAGISRAVGVGERGKKALSFASG